MTNYSRLVYSIHDFSMNSNNLEILFCSVCGYTTIAYYSGHDITGEVDENEFEWRRQSIPILLGINCLSVCLSRVREQQPREVPPSLIVAATTTTTSSQSSSSRSPVPPGECMARNNEYLSVSSSSPTCLHLVFNFDINHIVCHHHDTVSVCTCSNNPLILSVETSSKLPLSLGCPISPQIIVTNKSKTFTNDGFFFCFSLFHIVLLLCLPIMLTNLTRRTRERKRYRKNR